MADKSTVRVHISIQLVESRESSSEGGELMPQLKDNTLQEQKPEEMTPPPAESPKVAVDEHVDQLEEEIQGWKHAVLVHGAAKP